MDEPRGEETAKLTRCDIRNLGIVRCKKIEVTK